MSPAPESIGSSLISEKIVLCDRVEAGRDGQDIAFRFQGELDRFCLLLTVFWMRHIRRLSGEQRWTIEPRHDNGELRLDNKLLQLGYNSQQPPPDAAQLGSPQTGDSRSIDRLNVDDWSTIAGEPFRPSDDAQMLFETFERADLTTAQRFVEACKAYHTSGIIGASTTTGAIAYLIVAAESLIEESLPVCATCKQSSGVLAATRRLFFRELPCLRKDEIKVKTLLNRAYEIRSRHFHDAQFLAGELDEWHTVDILLPDAIELRDLYGRLMALVNGLLVGWLVRRVTGSVWPRALGDFPDWREHKHFSVSFQIGQRAEPPALGG